MKKILIMPEKLLSSKNLKHLPLFANKVISIDSSEKRYKVIKDTTSNKNIGKLGHVAFLAKEIHDL